VEIVNEHIEKYAQLLCRVPRMFSMFASEHEATFRSLLCVRDSFDGTSFRWDPAARNFAFRDRAAREWLADTAEDISSYLEYIPREAEHRSKANFLLREWSSLALDELEDMADSKGAAEFVREIRIYVHTLLSGCVFATELEREAAITVALSILAGVVPVVVPEWRRNFTRRYRISQSEHGYGYLYVTQCALPRQLAMSISTEKIGDSRSAGFSRVISHFRDVFGIRSSES
jgi:hypothetical protein